MLITVDDLRKKNACPEGIELFIELFGESVEYSVELHQRLLLQYPDEEVFLLDSGIVMPLCLQAGHKQTVIAGYRGTATAGYRGTANAGVYGTANAGYCGTAIAGDYGTATAGTSGTATAGNYGIATAGNYGTATVGHNGKARAGLKGEIRIRYWDKANDCYRTQCGFIDGAILKADVFYKLDVNNQFVEA